MRQSLFRITQTIVLLLLLFVGSKVYAQTIFVANETKKELSIPEKKQQTIHKLDRNAIYTLGTGAKIAADFYTKQTGFFCNTERALEKKTKIPLKFRLGSLSYTEKLEGY